MKHLIVILLIFNCESNSNIKKRDEKNRINCIIISSAIATINAREKRQGRTESKISDEDLQNSLFLSGTLLNFCRNEFNKQDEKDDFLK